MRVCVDFRRVNKLTAKDPSHIPLITEIVGRQGVSVIENRLKQGFSPGEGDRRCQKEGSYGDIIWEDGVYKDAFNAHRHSKD